MKKSHIMTVMFMVFLSLTFISCGNQVTMPEPLPPPGTPGPTNVVDPNLTVENDGIQPEVQFNMPSEGEKEVALNIVVKARFTKDMDPSTIDNKTFLLKDESGDDVSGTVTYNVSDKIASFKPNSLLTSYTVYTAVITLDMTDTFGNKLKEGKIWGFITGN